MNDERTDPWSHDWPPADPPSPKEPDALDLDDFLDADSAGLAAPAAPPAPVRRFCRTCGTVVDDFTGICPRCEPSQEELDARPPRREDAPSIASSLGLYFAVLGTILIGAISIRFGAPEAKTTCLISAVMSVVVLLWVVGSWKTVSPCLTTVPAAKWFIIAALGGGATYLLAMGMMVMLAKVLQLPEVDEVGPMMEGGLSLPVIFLLLSVQPPIFEELAFRGIIQPAMMHYMSVRDAIIVSSLLFMVLHLMPLSFPHLFVIGLSLGYLRHKTGSLYPCILLHFVHNTLVLLTDMP
ncbi:MAG: type II CAAX endopeptidase family protein [Phycisphaeraceae bacterium]